MHHYYLFLLPLLLLLGACERERTPVKTADPATIQRAADTITEAQMHAWIAELADDRYEGRGPGTDGERKALEFIVEQLREAGIQPGGEDGSWYQYFQLIGSDTQQPKAWSFKTQDGTRSFKPLKQFVTTSGHQKPQVRIDNAELVFVGYGIQAPEYDWDDFKGADLKGKILVMLNNDPDWSPDLFEGERRLYYGRWDYKYEQAAKVGAAGAIIIHTTPSAGYGWEVVRNSWSGTQYALPDPNNTRARLEAWMTYAAMRELLGAAGHNIGKLTDSAKKRDFQPVPLGITTSLTLNSNNRSVNSANVLGLIPGSDPELADEYILYTAHHDHLGIGVAADDGDRIYNGARDNASGVVVVMSLGRALASLGDVRPRRSTLIAFVGAEEQGLLGSAWLAGSGLIHPGKMAAVINFDNANTYGPTSDIGLIGKGKSDDIDLVVERQARLQRRSEVIGDTDPSLGIFYRSDHFSFAKHGVPSAYFRAGQHFIGKNAGRAKRDYDNYVAVSYHQPSDEYDPSWDLSGMEQDAKLALRVGVELGNADAMPSWKPGDEFEAERLRALEDAGD